MNRAECAAVSQALIQRTDAANAKQKKNNVRNSGIYTTQKLTRPFISCKGRREPAAPPVAPEPPGLLLVFAPAAAEEVVLASAAPPAPYPESSRLP